MQVGMAIQGVIAGQGYVGLAGQGDRGGLGG